MRRWIVVFLVILSGATQKVLAQTPTEAPTVTLTPSPTNTPTPEPYLYVTLQPEEPDEQGQMARLDYTVSAGEAYIALLLIANLLSGWGIALFVLIVRRK